MNEVDSKIIKKYKNKDWLHFQYIKLNKSYEEMGRLINVSNSTIWRWLKLYSINIKSKKNQFNKQWLYDQYIILNKTPKEIAILAQVKSSSTILNWLDNYKIKRINLSNRNTQSYYWRNYKFLYDKYVVKKKSSLNIGKEVKVSPATIRIALKKFNISIRNLKESHNSIEIHNSKKRNNSYKSSKSEKQCLNYLKKNVDKNIKYQVNYKNFLVDFYSPLYKVYIEFDGDYWHGYTKSKEELQKTKQGKNILKAVKKDELKNKIIPNLIRIRESNFLKNPIILKEKIKTFIREAQNGDH